MCGGCYFIEMSISLVILQGIFLLYETTQLLQSWWCVRVPISDCDMSPYLVNGCNFWSKLQTQQKLVLLLHNDISSCKHHTYRSYTIQYLKYMQKRKDFWISAPERPLQWIWDKNLLSSWYWNSPLHNNMGIFLSNWLIDGRFLVYVYE